MAEQAASHDATGHNGDHKAHSVTIEVNGKAVTMPQGDASGLAIKEAAIAQGVSIQQNFVLQQELANGTGKVIGDTDLIHLHAHLSFTAIAPDDNS